MLPISCSVMSEGLREALSLLPPKLVKQSQIIGGWSGVKRGWEFRCLPHSASIVSLLLLPRTSLLHLFVLTASDHKLNIVYAWNNCLICFMSAHETNLCGWIMFKSQRMAMFAYCPHASMGFLWPPYFPATVQNLKGVALEWWPACVFLSLPQWPRTGISRGDQQKRNEVNFSQENRDNL